MYQCYDPERFLIKVPDYREALSLQDDPQEMIDVMVEVIPSENHLYRTVKPDAAADIMKQTQANEWKAKCKVLRLQMHYFGIMDALF